MKENDPYGTGCNPLVALDEQPTGVEHFTADGVYIRQIVVKKKDSLIPQHAHAYDHMTMLVKGSIRVWEDGKEIGERVAPTGVYIKAGVKHSFQTLEDDTVLYCIHNTSRTGAVEIQEEHQNGEFRLCHSGS